MQENLTKEEKRKRKLDVILRNAAKAFTERGYYKTSLDDIAKMQNVTKPTLYYYIKNKEDILVKCEEVACGRINAMLDDIMSRDASGFEMLYHFIRKYTNIITDDVARCHVRHRGQMEDKDLAAQSIQNHKDIENRVREIIRLGIKDGSIRDCNSTICCENLNLAKSKVLCINGCKCSFAFRLKVETKCRTAHLRFSPTRRLLHPRVAFAIRIGGGIGHGWRALRAINSVQRALTRQPSN